MECKSASISKLRAAIDQLEHREGIDMQLLAEMEILIRGMRSTPAPAIPARSVPSLPSRANLLDSGRTVSATPPPTAPRPLSASASSLLLPKPQNGNLAPITSTAPAVAPRPTTPTPPARNGPPVAARSITPTPPTPAARPLPAPKPKPAPSVSSNVNYMGIEANVAVDHSAIKGAATTAFKSGAAMTLLKGTKPVVDKNGQLSLQIDPKAASKAASTMHNAGGTKQLVDGMTIKSNGMTLKESKPSVKVRRFKAIEDFVGTERDDLSFRRGDVLNVNSKLDDNWFEGEFNGRTGIIPIAYLQEVL